MASTSIRLSRDQVLAFRRRVANLDERVPRTGRSLRSVAWAGLQDSMPRAAVLSVHARVEGIGPTVWEDDAYVQVWGPRYSTYVIPRKDLAVFTLGRLPTDSTGRMRALDTASEIERHLGRRSMSLGELGRALGGHPNRLRYAATTGRILIRWDGARQPTIWTVPAPDVDPDAARLELARRYLHVFGPSTHEGFALWAGIRRSTASEVFDQLAGTLVDVVTPSGIEWMLGSDVDEALRTEPTEGAVRLLPSGDTYYLLQGSARGVLLPDAERQDRLWTSRVWPGALLVDGDIVGTWRRRKHVVVASPWIRLSTRVKDAIEAEAATLPLPEDSTVRLEWS